MVLTEKRKDRINTIINDLTFVGTKFNKDLFEQLCTHRNNYDIDYIFSQIHSHKRLQSITLLINYLTNIDNLYSLEKYVDLFESDNLSIRQEACITLQKIPIGRRRAILLDMLKNEHEDVVLYALGEVYQHSESRAVHSILALFEKWDHKEIQVEAIRILRQIRDERALPTLESLAEKGSGDIQEEAFSALEKFAAFLKWPAIKKWLRSDLTRQRQIAYFTMIRKPQKKWSDRLAQALREEDDYSTKVRVLTAIRNIRTPLLFKAVLDLSLSDDSIQIQKTAQAVLIRINQNTMGRWLVRELSTKDKQRYSLVLYLLGYYTDMPNVRSKLFQLYGSSVASEKLIILGALSRSRQRDTKKFLRLAIDQGDQFSYSATCAYLNIFSQDDWQELYGIITSDLQESSVIQRLVLGYIYRLPENIRVPDNVIDHIESLLIHPHVVTRALASRCYTRICSIERMQDMLVLLSSCEVKIQQDAIFREIVHKVDKDPESVTDVVTVCLTLRNLIPYTAKLFNYVAIEHKPLMKKVLHCILDLKVKVETIPNDQYALDSTRVMLFMRNLLNKQKSVFLSVFETEDWTDDETITIMTVINSSELHEFGGLQCDFMAEKYRDCSLEAKKEFLEFFKKLPHRSDAIEDTVLDELTKKDRDDIFEQISEVIHHWV